MSRAAAPQHAYLRRRGRLTAAQARALDELTDRYLVDLPDTGIGADFWREVFGRDGPLAIETCFGNGAAVADLAKSHPTWNCLGVDIYRPGFGALMLACERDGLDNVRIADAEVLDFLHRLEPGTARRVSAFFPDPWPKKRHHKRRLVNAAFAEAVAACLVVGGTLHLATDWADYAAQMVDVLRAVPGLEGGVSARVERPVTAFEAKGRAGGRRVVDLTYRRVA
ncbi:MAG: tRNA (guanosine(46)-N7)-methyltransferase TrmB [Gammaproteobacteria bacterium]|nr:tRNA (guanosine(46)-N7)-methyltransferase TrmB [Gammaproteobacteria bacterium]MYF27496.1 tRNA (guanosine(46)-N7)-methyltransferase TrmB [Gammaproteobacteria bacterium]